MKKVVLASASPRRKEILGMFINDFEIVQSDADEDTVDKNQAPDIYVQELAFLKAEAVCGNYDNAVIIAADTVVYNDGEILGKPKNEKDAFNMLSKLSGNTHTVYTGVCVVDTDTKRIVKGTGMAEVTFKNLTPEKISAYIETKEPMDKAGAYAVQGIGAALIEKISGDYFSIVGLPVSLLADILENDLNVLKLV